MLPKFTSMPALTLKSCVLAVDKAFRSVSINGKVHKLATTLPLNYSRIPRREVNKFEVQEAQKQRAQMKSSLVYSPPALNKSYQ